MSAPVFNAWRFLAGASVMLPFIRRKFATTTRLEIRDGLLAGTALFLVFTLQTVWHRRDHGLALVPTPLFTWVILKLGVSRQQAIGVVLAMIVTELRLERRPAAV